MMVLHAGFISDSLGADETTGVEKPWSDEKEIKRFDGYGAGKSDLERGYMETQPQKWIPRDETNYQPRLLSNLDSDGNQEPIFRRTIF